MGARTTVAGTGPLACPHTDRELKREFWNVRELENYVKRLIVLRDFDEVEREIRRLSGVSLPPEGETTGLHEDLIQAVTKALILAEQDTISLKEISKQVCAIVEKKIIDRILERTRGNKRQAADLLNISYKALLYKLREFEET